ncbi:MAG: Polysaccharide biosynthesis protein [Frankiales bacterium]|nr:Polysaccharide biosynthesis protein [Frankiales bacterium]
MAAAPGAQVPLVVGPGTRTAARTVVALSLVEVAGKASTFVIMVVAARSLGQAGFGAFSYALALSLLVSTVVAWGFDTVVTREGSRDRAALENAYADLVVLRLLLSGTALVLLAATVAVLGDLSQPGGLALVLLTVAALLDTLGDAGRAVAAAVGGQSRVAPVLVGQRLVAGIVGVTALAAGGGVVALSAGLVAGSAVGAVVMLFAVRRLGVPLELRRADRTRTLALVRASVAVGVNAVVSTALFRVDAILLGALAGSVAVGHYTAAYRLLETVMFINWAVARTVFPAMAAATEPWQVRRGLERGVGVCAFFFAPYAVLLLVRGQEVLGLLYGPSYGARGSAVLAWLAVAPLAFGVAYLAGYALYALDRSWQVLFGSLSALAVNVAANLVLIPRFDEVGAAMATTGAYLLEALVLTGLVARVVGRPAVLRTFGLPALAAVPAAGVLILTPLPLLAAAPLEGASYLVCWWALSRWLDPEGVAVLRTLVPGRRPLSAA